MNIHAGFSPRITAVAFTVSALLTISVMADDLVITSFSGNGTLHWTFPSNGVAGYSIEWASQAAGPWFDTWDSLRGIAPTGGTMSALVPMFYRVVAAGDYLVLDLSAGPDATNYPVSYLTAVPDGGWSDEYKTTKLVLRYIRSGNFAMGSPTNELGHQIDEIQHAVALTQPFYIGVFEVTQQQWERVTGTWPSWFTNISFRDSRPVDRVSYNMIRGAGIGTNWPANSDVDADSFMGRLRARTGKAFDLPTESQWEYAGRAGTITALNSGFDITNGSSDAHMSAVGRYWDNGGRGYSENGDTSGGTAKVGSYLPNQWGLYDIHGNVMEWCLDWYGDYSVTVTNPPGAPSGMYRVNRSFGWTYGADLCRVANRLGDPPNYAYNQQGCRVTLPLSR